MNIVIITSLYPGLDPQSKQTKADYYLAKEWVVSGHNVLVVHLESDFVFRKHEYLRPESFEYEGIAVYHIMYPRFIPRKQHSFAIVESWAYKKIRDYIVEYGFTNVDLFYCDFPAGNWPIISRLKECDSFKKSKFVPVFNYCDFRSDSYVKKIVRESSIIGTRSKTQAEWVKSAYNEAKVFVALSGVPVTAYDISEKKVWEARKPQNYLYVGDLIPLKNVDILIQSFYELVKRDGSVKLTIVGDGAEESSLKELVSNKKLTENVVFTGRLSRERVIEVMLENDVFVMASSPESFGIVYIEAMSAGCCIVAAKREGIDGVIIDGVNGFLVEPRDVDELSRVLLNYAELSNEERGKILAQSYTDVQNMSEEAVAKKVLEDIERLS